MAGQVSPREEMMSLLLQTPAAVRFLSVEPMLGPVNLRNVPGLNKLPAVHVAEGRGPAGVDWVIVGGESGRGSRSFELEWARSLRDQCAAASVPFFFKQAGSSPIDDYCEATGAVIRPQYQPERLPLKLRDRKGGDLAEIPGGPWPREFPAVA